MVPTQKSISISGLAGGGSEVFGFSPPSVFVTFLLSTMAAPPEKRARIANEDGADANEALLRQFTSWIAHRKRDDVAMFADCFEEPSKHAAILASEVFAKHARATTTEWSVGDAALTRATVTDYKALQDPVDTYWHNLPHKWHLVPRGLTIVSTPNDDGRPGTNTCVAIGMHKAFDLPVGGPKANTAAGSATLSLLEKRKSVLAYLTHKANGEMARVCRPPCLKGAWLFAQKNRAIVARSESDLKAASQEHGNVVAHAVEFGRSWFKLLRQLDGERRARLEETCTKHVLVAEKVGSKLQQHIVRESAHARRAGLIVFAAVPLDSHKVASAIRSGHLPRLGVRVTAKLCEECGVPYVGLVTPPETLQHLARPDAPPGELVISSIEQMEEVRRAMLTVDRDDLEGGVLVVEDPEESGDFPAIALYKCKVAIYWVRRRMREQMRRGVAHLRELPGLERRLGELLVNVPSHRRAPMLKQARHAHLWCLSYVPPSDYIDMNALDLIEGHASAAAAAPDDGGIMASPPKFQRPVKTVIVVEPGCGRDAMKALNVAYPTSPVLNAMRMGSNFLLDEHVTHWRSDALYDFLLVAPLQIIGAGAANIPADNRHEAAQRAVRRFISLLTATSTAQGSYARVLVIESDPSLASVVQEYLSEDAEEAQVMYQFGRNVIHELRDTQATATGVTVQLHTSHEEAIRAIEMRDVQLDGGLQCGKLAVFVVGTTGLGKSRLCIDAVEMLSNRTKPLRAVALDQDMHARHGMKASSDYYLADLRKALDDASVQVVLIHRNGPGSEATLAELRRRGIPFVAALPSDLLPFGPLEPAYLHACVSSVVSRGTDPGETSYVGGIRREQIPHPTASQPVADRLSLLGMFLRQLVTTVAPAFVRDGQRPISLAYFEPMAEGASSFDVLPRVHRVVLLSWALLILARNAGWDKRRTPYDGALEAAARCALTCPANSQSAWPRCDAKVAAERFSAAVVARFDALCAPGAQAAAEYVQICHSATVGNGGGNGGTSRFAAVFFPPKERVEGLHATVLHPGAVGGMGDLPASLVGQKVRCEVRAICEVSWGTTSSLKVATVSSMTAADGTDVTAIVRTQGGVPHITISCQDCDPKLAPVALALASHALDGAFGEVAVPPGDVRVGVHETHETWNGVLRWSAEE